MASEPLEMMERVHPVLPVFLVSDGGRHVIYTPGHMAVVAARDAEDLRRAWKEGSELKSSSVASGVIPWIERHSISVQEEWGQYLDAPFEPECLTIYPGNVCNLGCDYCYAGPAAETESGGRKEAVRIIEESVVESAARLTARYCSAKQKPFQIVLHGGGEPTMHWPLVERITLSTRRIARESGVDWQGYIATNGVLPERRAAWLAGHYRVGLSCDGPPDIQNKLRPIRDGAPSSPFVERTARIINDAGGQLEARATITLETIDRQCEIVEYLHHGLEIRRMRFEPCYRPWGASGAGFSAEHAEPFAQSFLAARAKARALGSELSISGARMEEIHGPYCDTLRSVLRLAPDGSARACFLNPDGEEGTKEDFRIGEIDRVTGEFKLDRERIDSLRRAAGRIPPGCNGCINIYHCARDCPEVCYGDARIRPSKTSRGSPLPAAGFRCRVQQYLSLARIRAAFAGSERPPAGRVSPSCQTDDAGILTSYLHAAPASIDTGEIIRQWSAIHAKYPIGERRMPRPVWAKRGFDHDGAEAWRMLCGEVLGPAENTPLSIYLHVPFCDRRCGYCDCHSISMPRRDRQREADYCRILLEEIDAWAGQGSWENRPVTTVHFGGGTPNYLSRDLFSGIVSDLRRRFGMTAGTEWALETTGSLLTGEHLSELKDLGIGRLHVGVQTLEEGLRRKCGRRQSVPEALRTLTQVLEMGFITSVDVIYGLPGQTLPVFLDSLQRLVDVGVHGFSLYRLNVSARNRRFVQRHGKGTRDHLSDYLLLQGGELLLRSSGYGKTHFTHYALAEDRNLYFTHPMRGEDLLAIGASADGFFGPYHYRHPDYEGYVSAGCGARGVLEGGLFESEREQSLRPAVASLMAGSIREGLLREMGEERLLDGWLECALLERQGDPGSFSLTANGSWFIDDMLDDLMKASSSQS